jgi:hypothetical protein
LPNLYFCIHHLPTATWPLQRKANLLRILALNIHNPTNGHSFQAVGSIQGSSALSPEAVSMPTYSSSLQVVFLSVCLIILPDFEPHVRRSDTIPELTRRLYVRISFAPASQNWIFRASHLNEQLSTSFGHTNAPRSCLQAGDLVRGPSKWASFSSNYTAQRLLVHMARLLMSSHLDSPRFSRSRNTLLQSMCLQP